MNCAAGIRWLVFFVCLFCVSQPLFAETQQSDEPQQVKSIPDATVSDVRIDGYLIFRVRGVAGYPANRRANEIEQRIVDVAENKNVSPDSIHVESPRNDLMEVFAGNILLVRLFEADAEIEGVQLDVLADAVSKRIKESIVEYRRARTSGVVVRDILYAVLLTLLLIAIIFGLSKLFRWFDHLAERRFRKQIESLEKKSLKLVRAQQVWGILRNGLTALRWILIAFAVYLYLNSALTLLPVTREIGNRLLTFIVDPLMLMVEGIIDFIPSLVFLVILIFLARYILRSIRALFGAIYQGSVRFKNFEPEWAWPTYKVVRVAVIIFAAVIAYPHIPGSGSGAFKGISLFVGVLLSLGSTSLIANVIAGYSMMYRRAFHIGDLVQIGDTLGKVMEMRLLVTHLQTFKNEEVVIPNSVILNSAVINYSSQVTHKGLILHTVVGIGYEVPWRKVESMLLMAAERTTGVLTQPRPFVLQKSLGDFAINYELNVHCSNANDLPRMYSELHKNVLDVFNEYNVQIMTPSYRADPTQPKLVPKDHWYDAPAVAPNTDDAK
jgi:small-conductance mechanosensitive channel